MRDCYRFHDFAILSFDQIKSNQIKSNQIKSNQLEKRQCDSNGDWNGWKEPPAYESPSGVTALLGQSVHQNGEADVT